MTSSELATSHSVNTGEDYSVFSIYRKSYAFNFLRYTSTPFPPHDTRLDNCVTLSI